MVECETDDVAKPWQYRYDVKLADWLEFIPVKHVNRLLKEAVKQVEDEAMPYYIRSQGPEGDG